MTQSYRVPDTRVIPKPSYSFSDSVNTMKIGVRADGLSATANPSTDSSSSTTTVPSPDPGFWSSTAYSTWTSSSNTSTSVTLDSSDSTIPPSTPGPSITTNSGAKLSAGKVAGIAIATAIAGILISGIVCFLLLRQYKRQNWQQSTGNTQHIPYNSAVMSPEKSITPSARSGRAPPVPVLDSLLPQPVEDGEIIREIFRLRDKIKNHTQSYYHISQIDSSMIDQRQLHDLATATRRAPSQLLGYLQEPRSRHATIRLYIGWLMLSRCNIQGSHSDSFLPPEVCPLANSIAETASDKLMLVSKWKVISGTLLQNRYGPQQKAEEDFRQGMIGHAMSQANSFLGPFIAGDSEQRVRNLEGIMFCAARFAFLLFTQPSTWAFDWHDEGRVAQPGCILVFPALLQISNEEGQILTPRGVFTEAEIVSGLGE